MDSRRGRPVSGEERLQRERAWSAGQQEREAAWNARHEAQQKAWQAQERERQAARAAESERAAWTRGRRAGQVGHLDVTGPDGVPVRIAVVWLGRFRATTRPLNDYNPLRHVQPDGGDGLLLLVPFALLVLLDFAVRWSFLRLTGRPCWAVAAAAGPDIGTRGRNLVLRRTPSRRPALLAAAALADRVERDGVAALTPR
ncbi:hypothetical protein ACIRS1_17825 [Kitasatospora sp. NPDC101176]|uniref:hypothetical protein n=1 Tax=Kitasatospora sp. NPDC101176 TaxID=3364099 RepID=UPI00381F68A8